ncbi:hypothetical protein IQ254_07170 [Nodosilinea sp. LEGE 07088]|uniref:hypothetical protein n=1 Tax=Nodosilinea sp. LEGE 07088 TaxID=2777968 RepID=UPI0018805DAD|nr:hypothetical protein [Nodosilinea sp. LEGE 07088]MBE9136984.1 hypothetical protein [Nodosilinea sp. LEGE 07088]
MNQPSHAPSPDAAMTAEHDLLASILAAEAVYPWLPLSPEAESYLTGLEAELDAVEDGSDVSAAITAGWQALSAQMTTQMAAYDTASALSQPAVASVLGQISQFQERIPGGLLQSLATSATTLARSGQPLIDQLVQCVSVVLPTWNADDLAVLARPLAYSLRDGRGEILDLNLRAISTAPWENLSDIEQARLTLAIASVALQTAQTTADDVSVS